MKKIIYVFLIAALMLSSVCALASCSKGVKSEGACVYLNTWNPEDPEKVYYAKITVEKCGEIILLLDANEAPATVANFLELANSGFYDGLTIFRSQAGFVIQGGENESVSLTPIEGEFASNGHFNPISHKRGVISMARTSAPNSATSQFFITLSDSAAYSLDGEYAGFGYVIEGMDVVDAIASALLPYSTNSMGFVADENAITIVSAKIVER